jgi:hypothetical protein
MEDQEDTCVSTRPHASSENSTTGSKQESTSESGVNTATSAQSVTVSKPRVRAWFISKTLGLHLELANHVVWPFHQSDQGDWLPCDRYGLWTSLPSGLRPRLYPTRRHLWWCMSGDQLPLLLWSTMGATQWPKPNVESHLRQEVLQFKGVSKTCTNSWTAVCKNGWGTPVMCCHVTPEGLGCKSAIFPLACKASTHDIISQTPHGWTVWQTLLHH